MEAKDRGASMKKYSIDDIKNAITPIMLAYGVKQLSLFGSYARNDATAESDIDFHLIDPGSSWGYFKLCGFRQDLEECLGIGVDVLTSGAMDRDVLESVQRDEVMLFGQ
jgi:predicted nucleotidyltransferase